MLYRLGASNEEGFNALSAFETGISRIYDGHGPILLEVFFCPVQIDQGDLFSDGDAFFVLRVIELCVRSIIRNHLPS